VFNKETDNFRLWQIQTSVPVPLSPTFPHGILLANCDCANSGDSQERNSLLWRGTALVYKKPYRSQSSILLFTSPFTLVHFRTFIRILTRVISPAFHITARLMIKTWLSACRNSIPLTSLAVRFTYLLLTWKHNKESWYPSQQHVLSADMHDTFARRTKVIQTTLQADLKKWTVKHIRCHVRSSEHDFVVTLVHLKLYLLKYMR
jgi:hypothetical protein